MAPADIEASVGGGAGEETKTEAPAPGFAPEVAPRHKVRWAWSGWRWKDLGCGVDPTGCAMSIWSVP